MTQTTLQLQAPFPPAASPTADLRQFINLLSEHGLLRRIPELVDWKYELGEITRENQVPVLFENIKDYPGHRVFTNGLAHPQAIALALGYPPKCNPREVRRATSRNIARPLTPCLVETGPVLENIVEWPHIDFLQFPIPHWSESEAGRYIGTWHVNVTRDPHTHVGNVGVYRMQVVGPRQATVSTYHGSHLSFHMAEAERQGKPLEMAVAIGVSEPVVMAAGAAYPYGGDEFALAGSLTGKPIELIRCGTVDLQVPANSEIVIEGFLQPGQRVVDGPYLDYAGKPSTNPRAYLFEATRLMFRNNPIFRGAAIGRPGAEDQQLFALLSDLGLLDFHGSRPKHMVQNLLIRSRLFRAFQMSGRFSPRSLFRHSKSQPSDCHLI